MRRALPRLAVSFALLALAGCPVVSRPERPALTAFEVTILGAFQNTGTRVKLPVSTACALQYGGEANVPDEVRGQPGCRFLIPRGQIELDVQARALDQRGELLADFNGPVSFRVLPGDLSGDYRGRWAQAELGEVKATVRSIHQYGVVRVWAEDAPPRLLFDGGTVAGSVNELPAEPPRRTYASGVSRELHFEDQTLQSLQVPDGFDNRSSPFVGEFVTVGKNPESGSRLLQVCPLDPDRDREPALMVVTGIDPTGFFVTDLSACRLQDGPRSNDNKVPEPAEPCFATLADGGFVTQADGGYLPIEVAGGGPAKCAVSWRACTARAQCPGYLPGTFGSMFVYNYSFPEGLNQGDLLFTLSGAVQEFTSTTQLTFPAWSIAEKVRLLPPEQWNKWLQYARPVVLTQRLCGMDDVFEPFVTDQLCGHNRRNLKMESLESALVKVRRVKFPDEFKNCDFNRDTSVPFFCEQPIGGVWSWGLCGTVETANDRLERECNQACVTGTGEHLGKVCAEEATFIGFGQYVVELNPAGPAWAGLDDSLPFRTVAVPIARAPDAGTTLPDGGVVQRFVRLPIAVPPGNEAVVACDAPVHYRVGDATVTVSEADPVLPPNEPRRFTLGATDTFAAALAPDRAASCAISWNGKARINVVTKDAIPELQPDCSPTDEDAEKARQCALIREATFDVTGHLRHVQPGRPRWSILPRDPDDVCCYPGPKGECPRPLKPCK